MEMFSTLGVNWQLIIAQLVNFGILLAILSWLLYRPILTMIDTRQQQIKKSMEDVQEIDKQRREMEALKVDHMKKLDEQATVFLDRARKDADHVKKDMLSGAQREVEDLLKKGREQLDEDRRKMVADLQSSVTTLGIKIAQKVLEREFSDADQKKLVTTLEKSLHSLSS